MIWIHFGDNILILFTEMAFLAATQETTMKKSIIKEPQVEYITRNGKKTGVIPTLEQYEALIELIEDLLDTRSAERRKKESTVEYDQYRRKRLARILACGQID